MRRIKFTAPTDHPGRTGWPSLNAELFGAHDIGGARVLPRPEALPLDWARVFCREAPLTLEIGFRRGLFLRRLADSRPEEDHVGIEMRRQYAWFSAHVIATEAGPLNARLIWGDALLLVPPLFGAQSLSAVYVNFPDPWWKRRHAKRRLFDASFTALLTERLRPGGSICVKSDVPLIARDIERVLGAEARLKGPLPIAEDVLPFSHREQKCVEQGLAIQRFRFERRL